MAIENKGELVLALLGLATCAFFLTHRGPSRLSGAGMAELRELSESDLSSVLGVLEKAGLDKNGVYQKVAPSAELIAELESQSAKLETAGHKYLARDVHARALELQAEFAKTNPSTVPGAPDPALALEVEHALAVNGFDKDGEFVGPSGTLEDVEALEQAASKADAAGLPVTATELREIATRARARF